MPSNPTHNAARRLLKLRDVATELNISIDTLDRFIRHHHVPIVRLPSGRRRIAREDLDRVIEEWKAGNR